MRTEWCRSHIDEVAENCGLSTKAVREIKRASQISIKHPALGACPTSAVMQIANIKESSIQNAVITEAISLLRRRNPDGSFVKKKLSTNDMKKIIAKQRILTPSRKTPPKKESVMGRPRKSPTTSQIKSRVLVSDVLTPSDNSIVAGIISLEYANDEYEAISIALKWAADRIKDGAKK